MSVTRTMHYKVREFLKADPRYPDLDAITANVETVAWVKNLGEGQADVDYEDSDKGTRVSGRISISGASDGELYFGFSGEDRGDAVRDLEEVKKVFSVLGRFIEAAEQAIDEAFPVESVAAGTGAVSS